MASFRLVAFNSEGQLKPPAGGDSGLVELLAVGTELSFSTLDKVDVDNLNLLLSGGDADGLHNHDTRYFTKTELQNTTTNDTGADQIIATSPYGGTGSIQSVLNQIAAELSQVDQAGMDWQNSVLDVDLTSPPVGSANGARYLIGLSTLDSNGTGAWTGRDGQIAQWNGAIWEFTTPLPGMFITADDDPTSLYYFNGALWEPRAFESTTATGFLSVNAGEVTLSNLVEKNVIVGDASNEAVSVDTGAVGQIEATSTGLFVKDLSLDGSLVLQPFTVPTSSLQVSTPGDVVIYDFQGYAVAQTVTGDVLIDEDAITSIQPDAVKDSMIDWGLLAGQVNDGDLPSAYTSATNWTASGTVQGQLGAIDSALTTINTNISNLVSEDLTFLKLDGTRAMTGNLDMNAQSITAASSVGTNYITDTLGNGAIDLLTLDSVRLSRKLVFSGTGSPFKIENIADGSVNSDAVNFGQLTAVQNALSTAISNLTTTDIPEGSNLYYTDERVDDRVNSLIQDGTGLTWTYNDVANTHTGNVSLTPFSTDDLSEGANLYYTQARFDSALAAKTTTDLTEGANLYFTEARVRSTLLTGLVTAPGSIAATDSILVALGKLQNSVSTLEAADVANLQTAKDYTDAQVLVEKNRAEAAEASLLSAINQEITDRQDAVTNETNARTAEDLTFVKLDGSRAMTGSLSMSGTNRIIQLANGENPLDAVNKSQLDTVSTDLSSALSVETSNRISEDNALSGRLDILEEDPVTKTYVDAQDTALQLSVNNLSDTVTQEVTRIDLDISNLQTTVTNNYSEQALINASVQDQIQAEETARLELAGRVLTNEGNIENIQIDLTQAQSDISILGNRADGFDASIAVIESDILSLQSQVSDNDTDITNLQSSVSSLEVSVADNSQDIIDLEQETTNINQTLVDHSSRIESLEVDPVTKTYVDNKDIALNQRIDFITSNTDSEALDSLSEIVAAFQEADDNINNAITLLAQTASANLQTEIDRATAAETQLAADIAQEISDRIAADLVLSDRINLTESDIDTLENYTNNIYQDLNNLDQSFTDFSTNTTNQISVINDDITGLSGRVSSLETDVTQLSTDLGFVSQDLQTFRIATDSAIEEIEQSVEALENATSIIAQDLASEISRATTVETGLDTRISALENAPQAVLSVNGVLPDLDGAVLITTDVVQEGSANKYYSTALFSADLALKSTTDLQEGDNLYYTQQRFDDALSLKTTTDVTEGDNLYYTDLRVQTKLGNVSGDILPDTDEAYDLGSLTNKFKDLYLSGSSIFLGAIKLSDSESGLKVENTDSGTLAINTDNIVEGSNLFYTEERVSNKVGSLVQNGTGINWIYDSENFLLTGNVDLSVFSTTDLEEGSRLYFTNSRVNESLLGAIIPDATGSVAEGDSLILALSKFVNQISVLSNIVDQEIIRATSSEDNLQNQINGLDSRVSANELSITNILQSVQDLEDQVGEDLQQAIANLNIAIANEETARIAADAQVLVDANTYTDTSVSGEASLRENADSALSSRLDILELDPVTKTYVDSLAEGISIKPSVKAATTADLNGTYENGTNGIGSTITISNEILNIDGVVDWSLFEGVLVKDQINKGENGRYFVSQIGNETDPWVLTRCGLCDEISEIPGAYVWVQGGDTLSNTGWAAYVGPDFAQVGIDDIVWYQFSGVGTLKAGLGLNLVDSEFSVKLDGTTLAVGNDGLKINDSYTQNLEGLISAETLARETADITLSSRIDTLEDQVGENLQQAIADLEAADSALSARLTVLELDPVTKDYVDSADAAIIQSLNTLDSYAQENRSLIDQESQQRVLDITNLSERIDAEESARALADSALSTRLATLELDPVTKTYVDTQDDNVLGILTGEIALVNTRIDDLETEIEANIQPAIAGVQADLTTEQAERIAADEALSARIDSVLSNLDPEAIDSFTEVVTQLQAQQDSLIAVDQALQTAIAAEETRAVAAENLIAANLATEIQDRIDADTQLQSQINSAVADLAQEITDRENADSSIVDSVNTLDVYAQEIRFDLDSLDVYAQEIRSDLEQETINRISEDQNLQNLVDQLQSSVDLEFIDLKADLAEEISVRAAADQALSERIDDLLSNLDPEAIDSFTEVVAELQNQQANLAAVDQSLQTAITEEEARALAAEGVLQSSINQEVSDRQEEITRVEGLISDEETARITGDEALSSRLDSLELDSVTKAYVDAADSSLDSKITTEKNRIDSILSLSDADKDSFKEIVDLINSVDTENDTAFAGYVISNNARSTQIESDLTQEVSDRVAADQALQAAITEEETRAVVAENDIIDNLNAEIADRTNADLQLQSEIDLIESNLAQEILDRQSADIALQANIDSEESARIDADSQIINSVDALDVYAQEIRFDLDSLDVYAQEVRSDLDQEVLDRNAGDQNLQDALDAEILRATNAELNLQQQVDYITSNLDPEKLDSLTEIVDALEEETSQRISADQEITETLQVYGAILDKVTYKLENESFVVNQQVIDNGYIELGKLAAVNSIIMTVDRLATHEGADFYTEVHNGVTRIIFSGLLAQGESQALEVNENIYVRYSTLLDAFAFPIELAVGVVIPAKNNHTITLSEQNISDGYVYLPHKAVEKSVIGWSGRLALIEGSDYIIEEENELTKIIFAGESASSGSQALQAGENPDVLHFKYEYYYS